MDGAPKIGYEIAMDLNELERLLKAKFPDASIQLSDMTGGGDHLELEIESVQFKSKSPIQQHRMIYEALGDLMNGSVHALKIKSRAKD